MCIYAVIRAIAFVFLFELLRGNRAKSQRCLELDVILMQERIRICRFLVSYLCSNFLSCTNVGECVLRYVPLDLRAKYEDHTLQAQSCHAIEVCNHEV